MTELTRAIIYNVHYLDQSFVSLVYIAWQCCDQAYERTTQPTNSVNSALLLFEVMSLQEQLYCLKVFC